MKVAFINFEPSTKAKDLLTQFKCQVVPASRAQLLFFKCFSLKEFLIPSHANSLLVLFSPKKLIESKEFQHALSLLKEAPLVFSWEDWEETFTCNFPALIAHLHLRTTQKQQHEEMIFLSKQIEQLLSQFQEDVELATKIHHQLLPSSDLKFPGISVTSKYLPAAGLGGDYFDVFDLKDKRHLGVLIADSQTHGMAAALLSTLLKIRLEDIKERGSLSESLMNQLNCELYQVHQSKLPGLDLTFGLLDRTTLSFEYASAGSLRPLIWNYPTFSELPCSETPPLGINPNYVYTTKTIQLKPGDLLFFHTNGLEAIFGKKGNPLRTNLAEVFASIKKMDPVDFQTELLAQINRFQEEQSELPDDITLVQLLIDKKTLYLTQSK